jgi:hypothetical protein
VDPSQLLTTVWATDEDLAVRATGDFQDLAPKWQCNASGADGVFAAGPTWVLTSASVDFAAQGLAPGHVVVLNAPRPYFTDTGSPFAVDSVNGHSVTLRRLGKPPGVGQPPAPAAGLSGVSFVSNTLDPQTESVTYEINRRWGIDPLLPDQTPADLYDPRTFQQLCVVKVLERLYAASPRSKDGDWSMKLREVCEDRRARENQLVVKWGALGSQAPPVTLAGSVER